MSDFRRVLNSVIVEITPQPWQWTTPDGVTLTVIPVGLRQDPGEAEVTIAVTTSTTSMGRVDVTTTDLPGLITALTSRTAWQTRTYYGAGVALTHEPDGFTIILTDNLWHGTAEEPTRREARMPETQRLPLASALDRALDVARGWEE